MPVSGSRARTAAARGAAALLAALLAAACRESSAPPGPEELPFGLDAITDTPVVLVGAGDIGDCQTSGDEATAALLDGIPGTVMTLGDNVYPNGSASDFANCYEPTWGRHKARTRPSAGNHDYNTAGAAAYYAYFGASAGDPDRGYYSYDLGGWHVVVLNSNIDIGAGSTQLTWLRDDLAASGAACAVAYWHHPRFSSSGVHPSTTAYQPAWEILYDAGVELVLAGHAHQYERFAPQTPAGAADPAYGIRQLVVGTGGAGPMHGFGTPAPNSEVRGTVRGVVKLTLRSDRYAWEFVPVAGQSFTDAGSATCHGPPGGVNQPPTARAGGPYVSTGTVPFDGSASSDPEGDALTYAWDFGDGTRGSGVAPSHTYATSGVHLVTLTVTDAGGLASAPDSTTATIAGAGPVVVLAGAGNIAKCTNDRDEWTARLLDAFADRVMTLGDNAFPDGTLADYETCYGPTWGRHRDRTIPVLGNHEYDAGNADGFFDYFGARAGPRGLGYYSVDVGDWHVIALNERIGFAAGSAQERWLRDDLAANTRPCTLAMWHSARFMSSDYEGWTSRSAPAAVWRALYEGGADVVVNGHDHHYERLAPMRPDGTRDDAAGIRSFLAGTGGESLHLPTLAVHPHSEVRAAVYGVLKLTLRAGGYDWEFVPVAGESFTDAGSGTCR